jgi:LysM repeat protein
MKKLLQPFVFFPLLFTLALPLTAHQASRSLILFQEASPTPEQATTTPPPSTLTPADVITAVNNLRLANGLNALSAHPVLMQVAALQASALAGSEGAVGHARPCGMTLGQQLLSLGFPLWGDLSQDGYRAENWVAAQTIEQVMSFWQSDDEHSNTMLSEHRSHIGAAIAISDQIYVVLETALSTPSGQHQNTAYDILTGIPVTQTVCAGYYDGSISQYSIPVAVSTARPDGDVVHEVQYGQTLWKIADLYHVSVDDIKRMNGLLDDNIIPGWKLLIQKAATQPPPPTATLFTNTPSPTPTLYSLPTRTLTSTSTPGPEDDPAALAQSLGQNKTVTAALIVSFAVLVAAVIGFGRRKE